MSSTMWQFLRLFTVVSHVKDQCVENAGVAFVKGASERNEFFEKINEQSHTTNKSGQTRHMT